MAGERRPSILMTADTVGGVWTYAVELAGALDRLGFHVHLATMGAPLRPYQRMQLQGCGRVAVYESEFRLEWMPEPWDDVKRAGHWLLALERNLRPDLVHLNQFAFGALPFHAPKLVVAHSCVLTWWTAVHGTVAPAEWSRYRSRVAAGLEGADLVAAPTRSMLDSLHGHYRHSTPGRVLPNGRDASLFRPGPKKPFIFAAGRLWDEAKNLAALEAVAPSLDWPVRVAGSCVRPDRPALIPEGVQALGQLTAQGVARQMARAAIYALPARYEPFGLSVLEAALSGCALVLGDIPSLREVWQDAALYVDPGDHDALRQTLSRLIRQPVERSRMAAAAQARAAEFSPSAMVRAYLDACASLNPRLEPARREELQCA